MLIEEFVASGVARYEFRYMPVLGDAAVFAAVAVSCAERQGGFWPLHDRFMLADQTLFTEAGLRRQVTFEGLDVETFFGCVNEGDTLPQVVASQEEGVARGVQATPTIYVNDQQVDPTYEAIADAIQAIQAQAEQAE